MVSVYSKVHAPNFPSSPYYSPSLPSDNGTRKTFSRKKQKRNKGDAGASASSSLAEAIIDIIIDAAIDITISST